MEIWTYLLAILGGAFAGVINTFAGNGSAITLTILTELLGLPGNVANGTNRIGIFTQCTAGSIAFYRNGKLDLQRSWGYIALTTVGAIGGVILAISVSNEQFRSVFRVLLVVMLFIILIKPKRWLRPSDPTQKINWWLATPFFLAIGFYGGFIQMGMGLFFLAAMVIGARYGIIEANAVKLFVVALYTFFVILIFQWQGLIDWKIGAIMAIGQTAGGYFTALFAVRNQKAAIWAHRVLVAVVVLAILRMFGLFEWLWQLF